jgi:transcriptional regulator with XRE-family HTH domain
MNAAESADAWRELASALKALRVAAGLSGPALATRTGWSQSKVSKIENKVTRPSLDDVEAWGTATGAPGERIKELKQAADQVLTVNRTWRASHSGGLAARQRAVAEVEARATSVRIFQAHAIPGLLQVPEYAEQVLRMVDRSPGRDVAEAVATRMNRQSILYRPDKSFVFVLGEGALRWQPEFFDVREAQAERLLMMESRPNIALAVLPYAVRWPLLSALSFTVFDVPDDPTVLIEDSDGERLLSGNVDVARYAGLLELAKAAALTGAAARKLIRSIAS